MGLATKIFYDWNTFTENEQRMSNLYFIKYKITTHNNEPLTLHVWSIETGECSFLETISTLENSM